MGLDLELERREHVTRMPYSTFMQFRQRLAGQIGIQDLDEMEGYGGGRSWEEIDDPIVPFLNHSDCEGDLDAEACETIGPRLRELVVEWPEDAFRGLWEDLRAAGLQLAEAMEEAGRLGTRVVFR